jgi:short-subunit dehydrogenase
MESQLPWKSVWITGAGRGIGKALATLFAQKGLTVYVSSRTVSDLEDLETSCRQYSGTIIAFPLDITDPGQISELMQSWEQNIGCPDLVVLNAGTYEPFTAQQLCAQRCRKLFNINLQGTINCIDPVLKEMLLRNSGQIAVMASVAGYRGLPSAAAYGASKAALINFCEALRLDLQSSKVKLQVINPGFIRTSLTAKNTFEMPDLIEADEAAQAIFKGLIGQHFEIAFPKRFVSFLKLLRVLPYSWYFKLIAKQVKA